MNFTTMIVPIMEMRLWPKSRQESGAGNAYMPVRPIGGDLHIFLTAPIHSLPRGLLHAAGHIGNSQSMFEKALERQYQSENVP